MTTEPRRVYLVGGIDPSAGAGLLLDQQVVQSYGVLSQVIASCLAIQNHQSFLDMKAFPAQDLAQQFATLDEIGPVHAIKLGMLPSSDLLRCVADLIREKPVFKILDPILETSSGFRIADQNWIDSCREFLLPQLDLITPNLPEAQALSGLASSNPDELAWELLKSGCRAVLIKGGHFPNQTDVIDRLYTKDEQLELLAPRQQGAIRGTGCFLASAIAAGLASDLSLKDAVVYARGKLMQAIDDSWHLGMHRLLNPQNQPSRLPLLHDKTIHSLNPGSEAFPSIDPREVRLYPIVDRAAWLERLLPLGVRSIQIRIKDLAGAALEEEVAASVALAKKWQARLWVNDYWELAIKHRAYGVHLGQEDLAKADLTQILESGLRLGISTHCYEELARALTLQPSYLALGPIFETTCKSMRFGPQGFARLTEWIRLSDCPVIAIGGLKPDHIEDALSCGASGLALISDITQAKNPEHRTKFWLERLGD